MKINSLAFRLFATSAAWTLLVLPIAGLIIYSLIKSHILDGFDNQLKTYVWVVQAESIGENNEPVRPTNIGEPLFGVTNSGWYWQVRPLSGTGNPVMVSDSLATATLPLPSARAIPPDADGFRWLDVPGPLGQPLRVVERTGYFGEEEDGRLYSFIVAGPLDWPESRINSFGLTVAISLAFAGLGLLAATFLQVRFGLSPLAQVEKGLADIRSGAAQTLDGELPSEIAPLQSELNALIASNQEIIERARTQVGNLAHALKTPLAVITNEADDRETAFAGKVREQAEIMRTQVTFYLDRARMAARAGTIGRVTELLPVLKSIQRALERIHRDKEISFEIVCPAEARFFGEKHDLEEILGNIMDNASKWCRKHVRVRVSAAEGSEAAASANLLIEIDDDGHGLPAEKRELIRRRGVRLDESMPGSGLGLSIVGDLVQSYRGTLHLEDSELGGLRVRLDLPGKATMS
ncbi:MAG: sensor histidine kinase [Hyphomicrobiaceae bacterium]|nr:sensor histidine kinase [Hyphomicrobiaceae bacterium]